MFHDGVNIVKRGMNVLKWKQGLWVLFQKYLLQIILSYQNTAPTEMQ